MSRLAQPRDHGQSVWLDSLSREMLEDERLQTPIRRQGLTGVSSNPAIFKEAMASSGRRDGLIGHAAVAQARLAYVRLRAVLESRRWQALKARGAPPQRLLWASTGNQDLHTGLGCALHRVLRRAARGTRPAHRGGRCSAWGGCAGRRGQATASGGVAHDHDRRLGARDLVAVRRRPGRGIVLPGDARGSDRAGRARHGPGLALQGARPRGLRGAVEGRWRASRGYAGWRTTGGRYGPCPATGGTQ